MMTKRLRLLYVALMALGLVGLAACHNSNPAIDAIEHEFGPVANQAIAIAQCESNLNPGAISPGGGNWGLFQINTIHKPWVESMGYSWNQMLDPYVNTHIAKMLYDQSGWGPWTCKYVL
jgi:hypothetical protein